MKCFWKIKNDNNIEETLKHLNLPENYIKRLFSVGSYFYEHLQHDEPKYFYMTYDSREKKNNNGGFCWSGLNSYKSSIGIVDSFIYLKENKFKYKGEVNLRKIKLEKFKIKKKWWQI